MLASLRPAILVLDAEGEILAVHGGAEQGIVGYSIGELVGSNVTDHLAPEDRDAIVAVFADGGADITQRFHLPFPLRLVTRAGAIESVQTLTTAVEGPTPARWVVMVTAPAQQPITQEVMDCYLAGASARRVALTLATCMSGTRPGGVAIEAFVVHEPIDGVLTSVEAPNPGTPLAAAMAAVAGDRHAPWNRFPPEPYRRRAPSELPEPVADAAGDFVECDVRVLAGDEGPRLAVVLFGNVPKTLIGSVRLVADRSFDVVAQAAERAASLDGLRFAAQRDPLTGVANRARLEALFDEGVRPDTVGVLYVDLDGLKAVNDTHGHEVGDAILVQVAARITEACRSVDEVVRVGGDEFVVVVHDADEALVSRIGARMLDAIADANPEAGIERVTATIGATLGTGDLRNIVRTADLAMLEGKRRGRNVVMSPEGPLHRR